MSRPVHTERATRAALSSTEASLDSASYATIDALGSLEADTRARADDYARLNDAAGGLETDRQFLAQQQDEIRKYVAQAAEVCSKITELEAIVGQMDEWSRELVVKMKRLDRDRA